MKKFVLMMMKEMGKDGSNPEKAREVARKSMHTLSPLEIAVNAARNELTTSEVAKIAEAKSIDAARALEAAEEAFRLKQMKVKAMSSQQNAFASYTGLAAAAARVSNAAKAKRAADAAAMPPPPAKRVKNGVSSREESDLIVYFLEQQSVIKNSRTRSNKMKPLQKPLIKVVDQTKKE